jgi:hypothetical protein
VAFLLKLCGRERALRALNFEETDRVPIHGGWFKHPKFLELASGIKMKYGFTMNTWENPLRAIARAYINVGADVTWWLAVPERQDQLTSRGFVKIHGLHVRRDPRYNSPEDVVTKYVDVLPTLQQIRDSFDFEVEYDNFVYEAKIAQDEYGDAMLWLNSARVPAFDEGFVKFGYKNYLGAILRYRNAMRKYFECHAEQCRLYNEVIAKATVEENLTPFVMVWSDVCDDHGPMVSPKILDEIYFPYVRRSIEPLQRAGIKVIWHCDGNIMPILDSLINIVGVDGLQGFQEETGVDLEKIMNMKTKSGKLLIIFGSISVTTTLPFGSVEDVKKDVERCIDLAEGRGGFILCTANIAQPDVPVENIFAYYEHAREYGIGK